MTSQLAPIAKDVVLGGNYGDSLFDLDAEEKKSKTRKAAP
jgi:hypothetical protein